jgi:hypothetical protein
MSDSSYRPERIGPDVCDHVAKAITKVGDDLTVKSREALAAKAMAGVGHCPNSNPAVVTGQIPRTTFKS